ncbi:LarC family nickel insertion protein, partial [Acidimicrobiaceae bacterium]|nr:LarC family nickel insertion protein [Acidimicrobiaceae bacterium]
TMRHLPEILALFESLDPSVRQSASAVFQRLAEAEASVHQTSIDEVHFHEVGALDSIADVVASCAGIQHLNLEAIYCSTLSLGNGNTRGAHGPIPVPVPAVLQIMKGVTAVQAGPAPFESTTPTGAALLAELVDVWGPMPPMTIDTIGMGAGTKDSTEVANVLRVVLGQTPLS